MPLHFTGSDSVSQDGERQSAILLCKVAKMEALLHMLNQHILCRDRHIKDIRVVFLLMILYESCKCLIVSPEIVGSVIELIDASGEGDLQLIIRNAASAVQ